MRFPTIDTNEKLESVMAYGTSDFPFLLFDDDFDYYLNNCINWHWHPHLEFAVNVSGTVEYHIANHQFVLNEGEGVFINANNLHMGKPIYDKDHPVKPVMFSVVFSPNLLACSGQSVIYEKYILPIISNPSIEMIRLSPEVDWQRSVLDHLTLVSSYDQLRPYGFEMMIRNELSSAWTELLLHYEIPKEQQGSGVSQNQKRLQEMIVFIHQHYAEDLSANQIADSAGLSRSSCYRIFQDCMKKTPLEYLREFRIERAMQMLLEEEDLTVSEIGARCGFDSSSHFTQSFKKIVGKTPLAYRKDPGHENAQIAVDGYCEALEA